MKYHYCTRLLLLTLSLCVSSLTMAFDLTIKHNGNQHTLSPEAVSTLTAETLTTMTPWTDSTNVYQGVSIKRLMEHFNIQGVKATAKALNNYQVIIDLNDAINKGAFIASKQDGKFMKVRNKGPFWIIFPWSQDPKLTQKRYQDWSIWQLSELTIE